MSVVLRDTCPLGIEDETLSALRDEALPADELRRLHEHAATCAACAQRLEGYERLGRLLRAQRLSGPAPALWDDVRSAIVARRSAPLWPRWRTVVSPRLGALGAVAATLAVALLFSYVLHALPSGATTLATPTATATATITTTPLPTFTPTATALPVQTPVPGVAPRWQPFTLPSDFTLSFPTSNLTIAPSDGNTAYVCQGGGPMSMGHVIVTHDRGAHWTPMSDVDVGSTCNPFVVDQLNPDVVVAGTGQRVFASRDGGTTWQRITQPAQLWSIDWLATMGSTTYATVRVSDPSASGTKTHLEVSNDGMQTWQPIDGGITDGEVRGFWLNGASGRLLAMTLGSFWDSADGGHSWARITLPGGSPQNYAVQAMGDRQWQICSDAFCTTDDGQTWQRLPLLTPGGSPGTALAITGDGSLLVFIVSSQIDLYRLPASGDRWQTLGPLPALADGVATYPAYGRTTSSGVFWALPPGGKGAYSQFYTAPYTP